MADVTPNNWRCDDCGYEMYAEITYATVEVSFLVACPSCGYAMDRLDPLGQVEKELREGMERVSLAEEMRRRYA